MMKKALLIFLLLPLFSWSQPPIEEPPSPSQLGGTWFQYFEVPENQLDKKISTFNRSLERLAPNASAEVKSQIERVARNFSNYQQALKQEITPLPPTLPFPEKYSLTALEEIYRKLRSAQELLEADQGDLSDKNRQITTAQMRYERLREKYGSLEPESEAKLLTGLDLIAFRTSLETAKVKRDKLKQTILQQENLVKRYQKELNAALERLQAEPEDVSRLQSDLEKVEKEWEIAKEALRAKEAQSVSTFSFLQATNTEKLQSQLTDQELLSAQIKAIIVESEVLEAKVAIAILQLLTEERDNNFSALSEQSALWTQNIREISQKTEEWQSALSRDVQRIEGITPLEGDDASAISELKKQASEKAQENAILIQKLENSYQETNYLLTLLNKQIALKKGGATRALTSLMDLVTASYTSVTESLSQILFYIGTTPVTIFSIARFTLIMIATFWFSHFVMLAINKFSRQRKGIKKSVLFRLKRLIHYLVLTLGLLIALTSIGFDFSNFLLIAGALGVGIGFGLQSIFNNFLSGIIILFESQLKVGDFIEMESGIRGEVREINFRSTYIKTNDGVGVIVPNSEFINYKVVNWTLKEPYRRIRIPFSVSYDADKDLVVKVVQEATSKVPFTLKKENIPEPRVLVENLGADGIEFKLLVWIDEKATKRNFSTRAAYLWAIHDALKKHGIEIPYPQRDIRIRKDEKKKKSSSN